MYHERLITGVAATLGAIAVVLAIVGLTGTPVALPVALAFAAAAALMYDQLSGRMAARVYRRVERHARVDDRGAGDTSGRGRTRERRQRGSREGGAGRGGFGAGPREEWTPPRDGASVGEAAAGGRGRTASANAAGGRQRTGRGERRANPGERVRDDGPTAADAYRRLGVEPGADEATIRQAYREKVKEVHPDTSGGDEESFMAVKAAYERLTD